MVHRLLLGRRTYWALAGYQDAIKLGPVMIGDISIVDTQQAILPANAAGRIAVLWSDPLVALSYANMPDLPLGMGIVFGDLAGNAPACLLVGTSWSWNTIHWVKGLAERANAYEQRHPLHSIVFACNSDRETALFLAAGRPAATINHNIFVDENIFRPCPHIRPSHDAVYNARLVEWKRHELAIDIDTLLLIYFHVPEIDGPAEAFHAAHQRYRDMLPKATFANAVTPSGCKKLSPQQVNEALASARVGLCLSAKEGAMTASMEYLMAGLPVVSTRSDGGRDHFFDSDYCLIVDDNPRAVREGTAALAARNIPRNFIRKRTLARVEIERTRFVQLVQAYINHHERPADELSSHLAMLIANGAIRPWLTANEFIAAYNSRSDTLVGR